MGMSSLQGGTVASKSLSYSSNLFQQTLYKTLPDLACMVSNVLCVSPRSAPAPKYQKVPCIIEQPKLLETGMVEGQGRRCHRPQWEGMRRRLLYDSAGVSMS